MFGSSLINQNNTLPDYSSGVSIPITSDLNYVAEFDGYLIATLAGAKNSNLNFNVNGIATAIGGSWPDVYRGMYPYIIPLQKGDTLTLNGNPNSVLYSNFYKYRVV